MSRAHAIAVALALLVGVAPAVPAVAQPGGECASFRVEWNRGVLSPTAEKVEGFVYYDSSCVVTDVRIHVVAVDSEGRPIAETLGWVYGDIAVGARGYFVLPLPDAPAADYRVDVLSFDQVSSRPFPVQPSEAP